MNEMMNVFRIALLMEKAGVPQDFIIEAVEASFYSPVLCELFMLWEDSAQRDKVIDQMEDVVDEFFEYEDESQRNIREGQEALANTLPLLITPGVKLNTEAGVPLFEADHANPNLVIRNVDGKRETGTFVEGKFESCGVSLKRCKIVENSD